MTITKYTKMFWDFVDSRYAVRRVLLGIVIWMTWEAYKWATGFASGCSRPGVEIAAIIAAVLTPITALQGFTFKFYLDSKTGA